MSQLIDRIYARCEEIGDCWEWQGAKALHGGAPTINFAGKPRSIRRVLAEEAGMNCCGKVVTNKCRNLLCVNPEHLQVMSRSALQRRSAKENAGNWQNAARRAKLAERKRAASRITPEMVQAIRDDPRKQREIAQAYGVSQTSVSQIKRGARWADFTSPWIGLMK